MSVTVIVLQSSSFVFAWLCIVLRCWLLLSLLFNEQIREPLLSATGRLSKCDRVITAVLTLAEIYASCFEILTRLSLCKYSEGILNEQSAEYLTMDFYNR